MSSIFTLRVLLLLVLLGVVAVAGWWLRESISQPTAVDEEREDAALPDYYLENFTLRAMNPAGKPRYSLRADDMYHYAKDDRADLTRPHAVFHRPEGAPYVLDAQRGRIHSGGERVDLLGQVDIDREATAEQRPLHVTTRDARVFPNRDYVESDEHTVIRSAASHMQGVGVRAWFDQNRLQLLSQVEGVYERQQP